MTSQSGDLLHRPDTQAKADLSRTKGRCERGVAVLACDLWRLLQCCLHEAVTRQLDKEKDDVDVGGYVYLGQGRSRALLVV